MKLDIWLGLAQPISAWLWLAHSLRLGQAKHYSIQGGHRQPDVCRHCHLSWYHFHCLNPISVPWKSWPSPLGRCQMKLHLSHRQRCNFLGIAETRACCLIHRRSRVRRPHSCHKRRHLALPPPHRTFPFWHFTCPTSLWQSVCLETFHRRQLPCQNKAHQHSLSLHTRCYSKELHWSHLLSYWRYGSGHTYETTASLEARKASLRTRTPSRLRGSDGTQGEWWTSSPPAHSSTSQTFSIHLLFFFIFPFQSLQV